MVAAIAGYGLNEVMVLVKRLFAASHESSGSRHGDRSGGQRLLVRSSSCPLVPLVVHSLFHSLSGSSSCF